MSFLLIKKRRQPICGAVVSFCRNQDISAGFNQLILLTGYCIRVIDIVAVIINRIIGVHNPNAIVEVTTHPMVGMPNMQLQITNLMDGSGYWVMITVMVAYADCDDGEDRMNWTAPSYRVTDWMANDNRMTGDWMTADWPVNDRSYDRSIDHRPIEDWSIDNRVEDGCRCSIDGRRCPVDRHRCRVVNRLGC
jgi:hypothetical protein